MSILLMIMVWVLAFVFWLGTRWRFEHPDEKRLSAEYYSPSNSVTVLVFMLTVVLLFVAAGWR